MESDGRLAKRECEKVNQASSVSAPRQKSQYFLLRLSCVFPFAFEWLKWNVETSLLATSK